jgi:hypothetical protein
MRALIDESVPNANKYYQTYLFEPSPADDITLSTTTMASVGHMDFERLLTEMKDIGAGGELLVVTHGSPDGFLMLLKPGAKVSLQLSVMDVIMHIEEGIRRHDAIGALPAAQTPEVWKRWFADFEPGIKLGPGFETEKDWQGNVEKWFNQWFERQGRDILKLPAPRADLTKILDLLKDVRSLGFKRLEFRACQIGQDKEAMKKVAGFLSVKTVVGPAKVQTFYGVIPHSGIRFIPDDRKIAATLKKMNGRIFPKISVGLLISPRAFQVVAKDDDAVKAFVQGFIRAKFSGSFTPLVVGGLNSVGSGVTNYVFPLESDYKSLIAKFDMAAAAAAP